MPEFRNLTGFSELPPRRPASAPGQVEVELTQDWNRAFTVWKELEERLQNGSLACSQVWTETWLRHYGDLVPHEFAIGQIDGRPCGVVLVTHGDREVGGPFRSRSAGFGTTGEPDADSVCVEYNKLLVEPALRNGFVESLLRQLENDLQWEQLCLDGFAPQDALPFQSLVWDWQTRTSNSRYFDLQQARDAGQDVLARLGGSQRSDLRRKLKQWGTLTTEWSETTEEAEDIFTDLVQLHQARWNADNQPGAYSSTRFLNFHRELVGKLFPLGKVVLFRVRHDGQPVACIQMFVENGRLLFYQGGVERAEHRRSPGLVAHYLAISQALERGYLAYDFMCGEGEHKRRLSTHSQELIWAVHKRPRLKFRIIDLLRSTKRLLVKTNSLFTPQTQEQSA